MKKQEDRSPLARMDPRARWGFLEGARWARRGERRFGVLRRTVPLLQDHEAQAAVEGRSKSNG